MWGRALFLPPAYTASQYPPFQNALLLTIWLRAQWHWLGENGSLEGCGEGAGGRGGLGGHEPTWGPH